MRLLQDGVREGYIIPTDVTRKITMDGVTKVYQVYKIKLSCLYYNDQNDRISTWITQYKNDKSNIAFSELTREEYNKIIERFIIDSNPAAIEKTRRASSSPTTHFQIKCNRTTKGGHHGTGR